MKMKMGTKRKSFGEAEGELSRVKGYKLFPFPSASIVLSTCVKLSSFSVESAIILNPDLLIVFL